MESIVPVNIEGKHNDLKHTVTLPSREEALECFKRAYKRMLNPAIWHELCGALSPTVALKGRSGGEVHRLAEVNDYFQIDLPGPGPIAGDGYDWVKVVAIEDKTNPEGEEERFGMRLQPCKNPGKQNADTAHFFKDSSSSTFIIYRNGNTVTASYHGRNELPNNKTAKTIDNIRNSVVASGAFTGFSEAQWFTLIKAFLADEIGARP